MSEKMLALGQVTFDAVEYASRANALLGMRDSGKTHTAHVIGEQLMDQGIPIAVFDGIGRWKYLQSPSQTRATGAKGYEVVVAGGPGSELELTATNAADLVRGAMQNGISIILDLYQRDLSKADWRKIVRSACDVLLHENEEHVLRHVFLEEAHEYVPQRVRDGLTYSSVEKLVQMGGNVGVGVTLIAHRAADTNKSVLELCENLILHAQSGSRAIEGLEKWLERAGVEPPEKIAKSLSKLKTGEAWVWLRGQNPARVQVQPKRSFDANRRDIATKGQAAAQQRVDVSQFIRKMRAALEEKKAPPKNPTAAPPSGDVKELEEAVFGPDKSQLAAEYTRGREDGFDAGKKSAATMILTRLITARDAINQLVYSLENFIAGESVAWTEGTGDEFPGITFTPLRTSTAKPIKGVRDRDLATSDMLKQMRALRGETPSKPVPDKPQRGDGGEKAGRRLLEALLRNQPGVRSWEDVATLAGMVPGNGYFYGGKKWVESNFGISDWQVVECRMPGIPTSMPKLSRRGIIELWLGKLKDPAPRMIEWLSRDPVAWTHDQIGDAIKTKPGNGFWYTGLKQLRNAGLIDQTKNYVQLARLLREVA